MEGESEVFLREIHPEGYLGNRYGKGGNKNKCSEENEYKINRYFPGYLFFLKFYLYSEYYFGKLSVFSVEFKYLIISDLIFYFGKL